MRTFTLKGLWAHKRRLMSTVLAVTIGVSFLVGTMVLGDTSRATFSKLFDQSTGGTDAYVRPVRSSAATAGDDDGVASGILLDASIVAPLRAVDGVQRVAPQVQGYGRIIGSDGQPVGTMGPPNFATAWIDDPALNPYALAEGRAPRTETEVVINKGAATTGRLHVGDRTTVQTPEVVPVTIVGIATFGGTDGAGGSTLAAFTLEGAQRHVLHQEGKITSISVAAADGVSQETIAARLRPVLPPGVEAITGTQLAAEQKQAINEDFLDFFSRFLLIFAGIALLVATFSIYNTFSILVAQRTREAALVRALGATRRQVLASAVLETFIVGFVASAVGVVGGIGLAALLRVMFEGMGMPIPATEFVINPATIITAFVVGTAVTMVAGVLPARRAASVAPLAALRDVAVDTSDSSRARLIGGALISLLGTALVTSSALGAGGSDAGGRLMPALLGSLSLLVGVVVLGPTLATVAGRVIGWPLRLRGTTGELAQRNAIRNPRRTSGTAAALMIGVAVVSLFTVVAQSMTASVKESLGRSFAGDLVVSSDSMGGLGFSPSVAAEVAKLPDVELATGIGVGTAVIADRPDGVAVADPAALERVMQLAPRAGSLSAMGDRQIAVSQGVATERHWGLGSVVPIGFTDGQRVDFTVGAVYEESDVMGGVLMRRADWTPHAVQDRDVVVLIAARDGVPLADVRAAVTDTIKPYAGTTVQDRDEYVAAVGQSVNQALAMIYVMLALAIVIALMGIANTMALSIHERTRELGLLRAVGQTRAQLRSMVRAESVIIALLGTLTGVSLGVFLGWALVKAASGDGLGTFSAAPGSLAVVVVAGALAGLLAARRPARRAARLDVLAAIATD